MLLEAIITVSLLNIQVIVQMVSYTACSLFWYIIYEQTTTKANKIMQIQKIWYF